MGTYPSNLIREWIAQDGTQVTIRPIRPEDGSIEGDFVRRLSPRSKYFRFFSGMNELTPAMLARLTCIDYDREMALVAVLQKDKREIEIAVGRFVPCSEAKTCEFAIVVDDAWQHHGIGYQIMSDLIRIAKDKGFEIMKGSILAANRDMVQLAKDLGFTTDCAQEDPRVMEVVKDLR